MHKIGIIPLRAGSKGIPQKNRKKLLGRPLFTWVLAEAIFSSLDVVYVFTDDAWIGEYVSINYGWTGKVKAVKRSEESATDTASTEMAMKELAESLNYKFDSITLLQATSPLTTKADINESIRMIESGYDSVLSVVKTHRFIWTKDGKSINYDYTKRPRRQDFDGTFIENGAVYTAKKEIFKNGGNRLGGKIGVLEMEEDTLVEIDSLSDFTIIESLIVNRLKENKKPARIKAMVFDVDGVLTDATVAYNATGEHAKSFSFVDGMGFELLREHGVIPVVITSEQSEIVAQRMKKLKVENVHLGVKDKYALLTHLSSTLGVTKNEIAYMGDDINDLAGICASGWGICPDNAVVAVKAQADHILKKRGGEGAAREAIEFIINWNKRII
ncbi:MAG: acylneuraminate cytidylyltransferase [Cyclobacteriaceae bacterium]|nr:acylneuraminate cytidylyltransferase [Cyclobacteriaceae bacterium]